MGEVGESTMAKLRAEREETFRTLMSLSEAECRYPARWAGTDRTINFMLRAFSLHELDHLQHVQKLLRDQGRGLTEAQMLLMKANALRGELEALVLGLTDEEFTRPGPEEGDWSVQQIMEHSAEVERRYREEIVNAVARGRAKA